MNVFLIPLGDIQSGCMLYAGLVIFWDLLLGTWVLFDSVVYSINILLLFIFQVCQSFFLLSKIKESE